MPPHKPTRRQQEFHKSRPMKVPEYHFWVHANNWGLMNLGKEDQDSFFDLSPYPPIALNLISEDNTSPSASANGTCNKCLPGAPTATFKGLNVQSGSAPYLISTWMKRLFASNSQSSQRCFTNTAGWLAKVSQFTTLHTSSLPHSNVWWRWETNW